MFRGPSFIVSTMQEETIPIFKRLSYDWTKQEPGIEPTNPLGQCWVPPIVAFYDQQGLLRTYSLPEGSIRNPTPDPHGRGWTPEEMVAGQDADPDIGPIMKWKRAGNNRPRWEDISPESREMLWRQWERVSVGSFKPCRQLGSYSRRKQVWTYSVLVKNKFGLFEVLGHRIYEMRCLFVAVGLNARFIVLPHWDNMSQAHMLTHPVTLY